MTRPALSSTNRSAANENTVIAVDFIELLFPEGAIRASNADRPYTFGGNTYAARAVMLGYPEGYRETADSITTRVSILLSGVDETLRSRILRTNYHFAEMNFYLGLCDEDYVLLDDPVPLISRGLLSQCVWRLASGSSDIELSAETRGVLWDRDSAMLTSSQAQNTRYPGDTGMNNTAAIVSMEVEWGEVFEKASPWERVARSVITPHSRPGGR